MSVLLPGPPTTPEALYELFFNLAEAATVPFVYSDLSTVPTDTALLVVDLFTVVVIAGNLLVPLSLYKLVAILWVGFCIGNIYKGGDWGTRGFREAGVLGKGSANLLPTMTLVGERVAEGVAIVDKRVGGKWVAVQRFLWVCHFD